MKASAESAYASDKNSSHSKSHKCLCEMLFLTLFLCRLFGIVPITWSHPKNRKFIREDGQCYFEISKIWMIYSICTLIFYNAVFMWYFEDPGHDLSTFINSLNELVYYMFASILSIFGMVKAKSLCKALNETSIFLRIGLLCTYSKITVQKTARIGCFLVMLQLVIQLVAFLMMAGRDEFTAHFGLYDIISKIVHNVPFMFYFLFSTVCAVYVALFMCFDTAMLQTLNYDKFKVSLGTRKFDEMTEEEECNGFNTMKFMRCKGNHLNDVKNCVIPSSLIEDLDKLRRLHESIRQSMNKANDSFNPQIAIHLTIELSLIIMHLYSVILYINIADRSPDLFTIHCIDWLFVVVHTIGLMVFLLSSQGIRATQNGPLQQLSEYSSKHLDPEEFAVLKLFYTKMLYAPAELTASHFFTLDISLLAPITGSVVTYLLVALQFKLHTQGTGTNNATSGAF